MGTYSKGILGPFSGKVGTVVGSSWNGIDYMRSLPKPSSKAPTEAQTIQRVRMALAVGFLKPISPLLTQGFKRVAGNSSGFNVATSSVVKEAIAGVYPDFTIDYSKVLISRGELTGPWNATVASAAGAVNVGWTDNTGSGIAKGTDKAILLVYNEAKGQYVYDMAGADRSAATDSLIMPADFIGDQVHVWMAFVSADGKLISTSQYIGMTDVA